MLASLQTGASGVRSHGQAMTVTGHNIANSNTFGYKTHRAEFGDLLATQYGTTQKGTGQGSMIKDISRFHSQGTFENSTNVTDLAIDGDGFFILQDKANPNKVNYTREGTFEISNKGILTDRDGRPLLVKDVDPVTKKSTGFLRSVSVKNVTDPARETGDGTLKGTGVLVKGNLNKHQAPPTVPLNLDDIREDMFNFSTTVKVYDKAGGDHTVNVIFRKLPDIPPQVDPNTNLPVPGTAQINVWAWFAVSDGADIKGGTAGALQAQGGGFLQFTDDGRFATNFQGVIQQLPPIDPNDPTSPPGPKVLIRVPNDLTSNRPKVGFDFANTLDPVVVGFDFGEGFDPTNPSDKKDGLDGMTSFVGENVISHLQADGNQAGNIANISIENNGIINGIFDNGRTRPIGMVQLATFTNVQKLGETGMNLYAETSLSGPAMVGDPGFGDKGNVRSLFVEKSNVDLGREFVNMIEYQRGFQANTRVITASDEMLQELVALKR